MRYMYLFWTLIIQKQTYMDNMVNEFLQELAVADDAHAESPAAGHMYSIDESENS